jgi:ribonuclease G
VVYTEAELALRAVRDVLGPEFGAVIVDDDELYRRIHNYLRAIAPDLLDKLEKHEEPRPLFERFGLENEMSRALARRVGLPSGGYIVIDHTEAMTVIDVNTGRYVGRRFLEDTILRTNLEACREIVRQLRLRDIGGIIVIDFIDMASRTNREAVLTTLEAELAQDRTKTYVVELSPLGLVEMTRQNVTQGLREIMTTTCPECHGYGRVVSEESALIRLERDLRALLAATTLPVVRVEVHPRMAALLAAGPRPPLPRLEAETGRRVLLEHAAGSVPLGHLEVVPD